MNAHFVIVRGNNLSQRFSLDPNIENRLGRGADCQVLLNDPLSSRTHAIVKHLEGQWRLFDSGSRNGTLVNGAKTDEALLLPGVHVRIGGTELEFQLEHDAPDATLEAPIQQTLLHHVPISGGSQMISSLDALRDRKRAQDLLDLYQLSFRLLSVEEPLQVADIALDVLRARTSATVVGFLTLDEKGQLRPQLIVPADSAGQMRLSNKLTDLVSRQAKAIWIKNEKRSFVDGPLQHYADAICSPLTREGRTVGAIHLYRLNQQFEDHDFEFVISASNILSASLFRAQQQAAVTASRDRLIARIADVDEMIGTSKPIVELKERIQRVAKASGCVLIRGESGTGKELIARGIHRASARHNRPMLCVNCAAIPSELMDSQLFGHKQGAFTGADKDHTGWFQQSDTGTLFLDEVGELSLEGQAKLLRVLEGHPFLPVGSNKEVRVDVRVIAATNRDLREFVREKKFREDLFYRLGVFELTSPPLRDRSSDVEMLVDFFLDHFRRQHGRQELSLSAAARKRLLEYSWPGNIRQLRNVIDSAVVMGIGPEILPSDLGLHDLGDNIMDSLRIDDWEQRLIREALKRTRGDIPASAELLGISRATLYRRLEIFQISKDEFN